MWAEAEERLNTIINSDFSVIVGDANGADKAIQEHLKTLACHTVTVFCSGVRCRNNLGGWPTRHIDVPASAKGFQFYAAKDRQMAREADFGLMLWDGKNAGTVLNVLRLIGAGKKTVPIRSVSSRSTCLRHVVPPERAAPRAFCLGRAARGCQAPSTRYAALDT